MAKTKQPKEQKREIKVFKLKDKTGRQGIELYKLDGSYFILERIIITKFPKENNKFKLELVYGQE